jgi:lipoprotein NlpI
VARYLLGESDVAALLAAAAAGGSGPTEEVAERRRRERRCEAHGYIALLAERRGEPEKAVAHYRRCLAEEVPYFDETRWARARLRRLAPETGEE